MQLSKNHFSNLLLCVRRFSDSKPARVEVGRRGGDNPASVEVASGRRGRPRTPTSRPGRRYEDQLPTQPRRASQGGRHAAFAPARNFKFSRATSQKNVKCKKDGDPLFKFF